jgi:UDP-glucose 4-epimerase
VIAKVIAAHDVDTVVHAGLLDPVRDGVGVSAAKEHNVMGSMQLLAACQRAPGLERLVVRSSSRVYGSSSADPAVFHEESPAMRPPRSGLGRDLVEVEGYVRGFSRRRPDVTVTMLRVAEVLGPGARSLLADHLRPAFVRKPLGYDARLQLLHSEDELRALVHATTADVHGTFNVAGHGIVMLSQAARRLGRPIVGVPRFALARGSRVSVLGPRLLADDVDYLTFGRGLDTHRMRRDLGFEPHYTTGETLDSFAGAVPAGLVVDHPLAVLERALTGAPSSGTPGVADVDHG